MIWFGFSGCCGLPVSCGFCFGGFCVEWYVLVWVWVERVGCYCAC